MGSPLVGLQPKGCFDSDVISSSESLDGIGCLADPEQQLRCRAAHNPFPGASCAQQPICQPSLLSSSITDVKDEMGSNPRSSGLIHGVAHVTSWKLQVLLDLKEPGKRCGF